ncbi:MAG: diaminobutyrate acetyltransferase [Methanomicrobia archaeon]|nr:diaminobutyrate acetyltransferase [Methanomicrobia archaeon]
MVQSSSETSEQSKLVLRRPRVEDAAQIHALITACKPLDLNSIYCYLLLCQHFADTCVVAEEDGKILAFLSGYCLPTNAEVFFIWQVAVERRLRGQGVGKRMLRTVLQRSVCQHCHFLETTIIPSNIASLNLFLSVARDLDTHCIESICFSKDHFGHEIHEAEHLLHIGPFNVKSEDK